MTKTAFVSSTALCSSVSNPFGSASAPSHVTRRRSAVSTATRARLSLKSPEPAPHSTAPTPSAFGRGSQFPRRAVGLYEFERLGINPRTVFSGADRSEGAFAASIGVFVLPLVIFPVVTPGISLEAPLATLAALLLAIWAVDALALGGALSRAAALSLAGRSRVAAHEAGHFLVGHLLGLPVETYALPSAGTLLRGEESGVQFGRGVAAGDAYRVAAVGMAGIAGEVVKFGASEGGVGDLADVGREVRACVGEGMRKGRLQGIVRWGLMEAVLLLREHAEAHGALCQAMVEGRSVEECVLVVERFVDRGVLLDGESLAALAV